MPNFVSLNYPSNKFPIQKPILPKIDWKNPLTQGLVFDALLSDYPNTFTYDTINQTAGLIIPSGATWGGTPFGMGLDFSAAASEVLYGDLNPSVQNLTQFSVEFYAYYRGTGGGGLGRIAQKTNTATNGRWQLLTGGSAANQLRLNVTYTGGGSVNGAFDWNLFFPTNDWVHGVITYDGSNVANLPIGYQNGIFQPLSASVAPVGTWGVDDTFLAIGNRNNTAIRNWDGLISHFRIWNRILSNQEATSLYLSPFQIYQQYQNSFFHTVGRLQVANAFGPYPDPLTVNKPFNTGSGIIIDNITQVSNNGSVDPTNFDHLVSSQDAVLIVATGNTNSNQNYSAFLNGVPFPFKISQTANTSTSVFYISNPPVGVNNITIRGPGIVVSVFAISLLGVNKEKLNPINTTNTVATGSSVITTQIQVDAPNSLILDFMNFSLSTGPLTINNNEESLLIGDNLQSQLVGFIKSDPGIKIISWTAPSFRAGNVIIVLEPRNAPSIWFPSIGYRTINDIPIQTSNPSGSEKNLMVFPSIFYQNSFLHTIGRLIPPPATAVVGTVVAETEQETSQIIIDKIYQGQIGGGTALSLQINIPSPDASLIVSGGSAIATGGAWQDVNLDGTKLTNLVVATQTGTDAEIWYLPNPPVGVHTLTITPTAVTGQVYANAMVVLGLDKKSQTFQIGSATDNAASSTIAPTLTPDAPNSLVVSSLSTIDATQAPTADRSQTPMYIAPSINASEYVLSTYELENSNTTASQTFNLGASVIAAVVSVSFRPANAPSMWFPNIDARNINDVVTVAGIDAIAGPAFGNYGYKPSMFYKNSFLHTVGRMFNGRAGITRGSTLLMMGVA